VIANTPNAAAQSQQQSILLTQSTLHNMLSNRFQTIDFDRAKKDVTPFINDAASLSLFDASIFESTISNIKFE